VSRLSRRSFIQAVGAGTGLAAASALAGVPAVRAAASPVPSRPALVGGPDYPIGVFWPPPPAETTVERYEQIVDAGFNFVITGDYLFNELTLNRALALADRVGLKVLVADDPGLKVIRQSFSVNDDRSVPFSLTRDELRTVVRWAVQRYAAHPSLAGFSLYDEPGEDRYPLAAELVAALREQAPHLLPHANLGGIGPPYQDITQDQARAHIQAFVDAAHPSVVSFDRYGLWAKAEDPDYFQELAIVRDVANRAGIPYWNYLQSVHFVAMGIDFRSPGPADLLWEVNTNLVYGCKGIQYFTYWTPDPARGEGGYAGALIAVDGTANPLFEAARTINTTWLRPVGRELKPLISESVQHANEHPLPWGATGFSPGRYVTSVSGSPVILGLFRAARGRGTRWLMVANRSLADAATTGVVLDGQTVKTASRFDPGTRRYVQEHGGSLDLKLAAGAAALYRLDTEGTGRR
jgi:hypothetical protein